MKQVGVLLRVLGWFLLLRAISRYLDVVHCYEEHITIEDIGAHHQFSADAILFREAKSGQLDFALSYKDIGHRVKLAEKAARTHLKTASKKSLTDLLPGWDLVSDQLDELVKFFQFDAEAHERLTDIGPVDELQHTILQQHLRMSVPDVFSMGNLPSHQVGAVATNRSLSHNLMGSFLTDITGWRDMLQVEQEEGNPQGRSITGIVTSIMALGALGESHNVERKLAATDAGLAKVAETVDIMMDAEEAKGEVLVDIKDEQESLRKLANLNLLSHYWSRTRLIVKAATDIAHAASTGKLSPAIRLICDVPDIFKKYNEKVKADGFVLPFNSSIFLHQLPAHFRGNQFRLSISVTIPLIRPQENRWTVLRHLPRPIVHQGRIVEVTEPHGHALLAIDESTGASIELDGDAILNCVHFPGVYYCTHGPSIIYNNGGQNCLMSIFVGHFAEMSTFCVVRVRNITDTVWTMGPNKFVIVAAKPFTATLNCDRQSPRSVSFSKTIQTVTLQEDCRLVTPKMSLSAANSTVTERMACFVNLSTLDTLFRDLLGDFQLHEIILPRPLHLSHVADEVRRLRDERRGWFAFSSRQSIILAFSVVAIVGVGLSCLYLYCRIKFMHLTPWHFVQGLLFPNERPRPPTDDQPQPQQVVLEVAPPTSGVPHSPTGRQTVAMVSLLERAYRSADSDPSPVQPRLRPLLRQVVLPHKDYVGGYASGEEDSEGDRCWKRRRSDQLDMLHTPPTEEVVEMVCTMPKKQLYSDVSEGEGEDDTLLLTNPVNFEDFITDESPVRHRDVSPAQEPPTPPGGRFDRLTSPAIVPHNLDNGARFFGFICGRTSRLMVDDSCDDSIMAYSFALTLGQTEALDFCDAPSQRSLGDFGACRVWLCLAGSQILMTVCLTPQELPEVDVIIGAEDSARLRLTYEAPVAPTCEELPTPEPMELDNDDALTNFLQGDVFAMDRLQRAADDLMRERGLIQIVERVMEPPSTPIWSLGTDQTSLEDAMKSVVVVPIRKKHQRPRGKAKKTKLRKNRKKRDMHTSVVSPCFPA